jgi:hypothetical protein
MNKVPDDPDQAQQSFSGKAQIVTIWAMESLLLLCSSAVNSMVGQLGLYLPKQPAGHTEFTNP